MYQGFEVKIIQDLSIFTLQHRRELRPLLDLLRSRAITYKRKFPFYLSAHAQGRTANLRVPEDLEHFYNTLISPWLIYLTGTVTFAYLHWEMQTLWKTSEKLVDRAPDAATPYDQALLRELPKEPWGMAAPLHLQYIAESDTYPEGPTVCTASPTA